MKSREELIHSKAYWMVKIQNDLYGKVEEYMQKNNLNRTEMAKQLGVTKGYLSQVLNGDFNHKLSKLVELSLAIGVAPLIEFPDLQHYIEDDFSGVNSLRRDEPYFVTINFEANNVPLSKKNNKRISVENDPEQSLFIDSLPSTKYTSYQGYSA